jgi:exodeoxyribonuclease V alpha subunit
MKLGIEKTAMIRLRAGISYALTEAMDEGHCGLPTDQLIPLAEELLEAPKELILTALKLEQSDGAVIADKVGDTTCTFLAGLYRAEQAIAERLIRIVSGRLSNPRKRRPLRSAAIKVVPEPRKISRTSSPRFVTSEARPRQVQSA